MVQVQMGSKTEMKYFLYTDGACRPNPGSGGWAFILTKDREKAHIVKTGSSPVTTNNRMELLAVLEGMRYFVEKILPSQPGTELVICSDSKYLLNGVSDWVVNWHNNRWRKADNKPVLNRDIWEQIYQIRRGLILAYVHIKGHTGHKWNEEVDRLAGESIHSISPPTRGGDCH